MAGFPNPILDQLRRRRIFEPQLQPQLSQIPEEDNQFQNPPQMRDEQPEFKTPYQDAYRNKLGEAPNQADAQYQPSRTRNVLGRIAAGAAGVFGDPAAGAHLGRELIHGKYLNAERQYESQLEPVKQQAILEAQTNKQRLDDILKRAQANSANATAGYRGAQAGNINWERSPEGIKVAEHRDIIKQRPVYGGGMLSIQDPNAPGTYTTKQISTTPGEVANIGVAGRASEGEKNRMHQAGLQTERLTSNLAVQEANRKAVHDNMLIREGRMDQRARLGREATGTRQDKAIQARKDLVGKDKIHSAAAVHRKALDIGKEMRTSDPRFADFVDESGNVTDWSPSWYTSASKEKAYNDFMSERKRRIGEAFNTSYEDLYGSENPLTVEFPEGSDDGEDR
jgi:hypothetical protein